MPQSTIREAQFLNDPDLDDKGGFWILKEPLKFYSKINSRTFVVPAGTPTDLSSVPRILWNIIPKVGRQDAASIVHDAAYAGLLTDSLGNSLIVSKSLADGLFYEGMIASKTNPKLAWLMYTGVHLFGREHIGKALSQ